MPFIGGLHRTGWLQRAEARSRSQHLMKRPKRDAPGHSSNRAHTVSHFAEGVSPGSHKRVVHVDIGLDGGEAHSSDEWRSTQPLLADLDDVGLVPAIIVGDVHAAQLPDRCSFLGKPGAGSPELAMTKNAAQQARCPTPVHLLIRHAVGTLGAAAGNVGLFAEMGAAQIVGLQAFAGVLSTKSDATKGGRSEIQVHQGQAQQGPLHQLQVKAREAAKTAAGLYGNAVDHAKICATLPIPLSRALDLVQQHPRVRFTNLDLHSPEVASAVRASDAQADKWPGDDTVSDAVKLGLLAYTLPGLHLDLPTTFGPFRFTPVFTNRHTAQMAWNCMTLPGSPRLQEQPLIDVIAHVRSQNKVTSKPQAANFQSALTPRFSWRSRFDVAAEGTLPRSRWSDFEDLALALGSGFCYPLDKVLTSTVENLYRAVTDIHRGPGIPKDWVDRMAFPVELPMLRGNIIAPWLRPVGILQIMARLHFDHAVASGNKEEAPQGVVSSNISPLPVGEGLIMIGDIGFEHFAEAAHFLDSPLAKLNVKIGFQNVAAIRGPLNMQKKKEKKKNSLRR